MLDLFFFGRSAELLKDSFLLEITQRFHGPNIQLYILSFPCQEGLKGEWILEVVEWFEELNTPR